MTTFTSVKQGEKGSWADVLLIASVLALMVSLLLALVSVKFPGHVEGLLTILYFAACFAAGISAAGNDPRRRFMPGRWRFLTIALALLFVAPPVLHWMGVR